MGRQYFVEVKEGVSSKPVPVSQKAITKALKAERYRLKAQKLIFKLQNKLGDIRAECKHPVCYDTPGFIYDQRHCVTCGYTSLL